MPSSACIARALAYNCCIVLFLLLVCQPDSCIFAEARKRGNSKSYRHRTSHQRLRGSALAQRRPSVFRHRLSNTQKDISSTSNKKFDFFKPQRVRPTVDARTERIRQAILTLPELSKLLDPLRHASNLNDILAPADNFHLMGTVRRRRLYCRVGMGYHLEIRQDGRVVGRHRPTRDGILEIFSVKTGVVGIRAVVNQHYLCMNKRGKLYSSSKFTHECEFRERIEENNFNTYASNSYSHHEKRTGYYMSLTKKGKSKKSKNVSGRQQKAHWLPRSVND